MKSILLALIAMPFFAFAQTVDVKDVATDAEETTIQITKGKKGEEAKKDAMWELAEGNADIEGDAAALSKEAKQNWKKACDQWKKEFRDDNKENKIISMNCGTPKCGGDASGTTCTSQASYKIKTKVN